MNVEHLGKYLSEINRNFINYSDSILSENNLTIVMWRCLLIIKLKNKVNLNDIAKEMNVDKALISRTIKKLEAEDLIIKSKKTKDSRSYNLNLSSKGSETLNRLKKEFKPWYERFFIDFTNEEIEVFFTLIKKGATNL